jgi:MYXO-CTERM domain-containing protein
VALRGADGAWGVWASALPASTYLSWALAVGDVDGDGRLDVLSAQGGNPDGSPGADERDRLLLGTEAQPTDTLGPTFRQVRVDLDVANGAFVTVRMAVTDRAGTALGPPRARVWAQTDAEYAAIWTGADQFVASVPLPLDGEVALSIFAEDAAGNRTTVDLGTLGIGPEDTAGTLPPAGECGCATGGGTGGALAGMAALLALRTRRSGRGEAGPRGPGPR